MVIIVEVLGRLIGMCVNIGLVEEVDLYEALGCKLSLVVIDAHFFEIFIAIKFILALASIFYKLVR